MHEMLPRLETSDFPRITRGPLRTLQLNLGYRCNQQCLHCHVNAGPNRKEQMESETIEDVLRFLRTTRIETLDLTGGAPELHPQFRRLVQAARELGLRVIDRCNLTILSEPGMEDLAEFLAQHGVEITASLPCYLEENVNAQRGAGVYASSMSALRTLNALGYGKADSGLILNLMYNPAGPALPPAQEALEGDYRRELELRAGVVFNRLQVLTNMPIQRFGSALVSRGEFDTYMTLLRDAFQAANLGGVMCRSLISVDWRGQVYDCDFNQMLDIPLRYGGRPRSRLRELIGSDLAGTPIRVADHCYGCTAGQGSSCGGALDSE